VSDVSTVDVIISVRDDYLDQMPALVKQLEAAGLLNIQSLDAVGIITGSLVEAKLADLARMQGIAQVQRSQEYRLPPPDISEG
jgi:hypothetical protein